MTQPKIEAIKTCLKRQGTIEIMFEVPFETICSVPLKPYGGTIQVRYSPALDKNGNATLIEWNSFAKWVEALREEQYLAEELTQMVAQVLQDLVKPEYLHVSVAVSSAFHLPVIVEVAIP